VKKGGFVKSVDLNQIDTFNKTSSPLEREKSKKGGTGAQKQGALESDFNSRFGGEKPLAKRPQFL